MNERTVFCEECRNDVEYIVEEKEMVGMIRGTQYHYVGKEAKCVECGAYVDVEKIGEANLKALYDVYREENGIVALEKIQAIPTRYAIGKRPLSILLGWGEHTFTRYADGDIPTRQYSETLSRLYDDLGQDGAGKSTVTNEVKKWLNWKVDSRRYYLGSGDHYFSFWKKMTQALSGKGGVLGTLQKICAIKDLCHLSKHVLSLTKKAKKYAEKGGVAIFDRYPQVMYLGINDGPKIRPALENKNYPKLLMKILGRMADKEEKNYKRAIETKPDLVIKMILPPEVSIQRKPEESLEAVKIKHEIIKNLKFEDSKVLTIDATMNFEEELVLVHNEFWEQLIKKA